MAPFISCGGWGAPSRSSIPPALKVASYIFYGLAVLAALGGISAASFWKDEIGQVFGTGTLFVYGGAFLLFLLVAVAAQNLAKRNN